MTTTFDALSDEARVWIFPADRELSDEEQAALLSELGAFLQTWTSHARPVEGAAELRARRFLLVGAQIPGGDVSGCGTDVLFHAVAEAFRGVGARQAPPLTVACRDETGTVTLLDRAALRPAVQQGRLTPATPVFNTALTSLGDLRTGRFERPAAETWLVRYFGQPVPG